MSGLSFDPVADVYDATRGLPPSLMDRVANVLVDVLGRDGLVLEAGVGTGRFAAPLRARGVRVVGVDIAPRMVARARAKGCGDLFLATATRLPFRDRVFHACLTVHMLHLVPAWRDLLREIARVTRARVVTLLETVTSRAVDGDEEGRPGESQHPMKRYMALARRRGYVYRHPGVRPQDLVDRTPPGLRVPAGRHEEVVRGEEVLALAATKSYSSQWNVPDEVHDAIMEELRKELEGRQFLRTWEVDVVAWDPQALARG